MEFDDVLFWSIPIALMVTAAFGWRLTRKIERHWLRKTVRAVPVTLCFASLMIVLLGIALAGFDRGLYSDETLRAPDRQHVARLRFVTPGALGGDMVVVLVRKNWVQSWERVYIQPGTKDAYGQDAEVHWLDSGHLLIRYNRLMVSAENGSHRFDENRYGQSAAGISIVCQAF